MGCEGKVSVLLEEEDDAAQGRPAHFYTTKGVTMRCRSRLLFGMGPGRRRWKSTVVGDDSRLDRGMTKHPPPVGPGIAQPVWLCKPLLVPHRPYLRTDASHELFELSTKDWVRILPLLRPSLLGRDLPIQRSCRCTLGSHPQLIEA